MYDTLLKEGQERAHVGLAGIDSSKLKKLRNTQLKECFNLIDEMRHKLEFVARIKGISFVDDAASRTAFSTWYALETIEGNAIWIANGAAADSKHLTSFARLHQLVGDKIRMIICLGDCGAYSQTFGDVVNNIVSVQNMSEAVHLAYRSGTENMKVIFSPAVENGVSYDEQGEMFKHEVNGL